MWALNNVCAVVDVRIVLDDEGEYIRVRESDVTGEVIVKHYKRGNAGAREVYTDQDAFLTAYNLGYPGEPK
jgi:hypothetical protein